MPPELDLKKLTDDMNTTTTALRDAHKTLTERVEKGIGDAAQITEKMAKCEKALIDMDTKFQAWNLAQQAKAKGKEAKSEEAEEAKQAFWEVQRHGGCRPELVKHLKRDALPSESKAFALGVDASAGYLAPLEFVKEIIKGAVEFTPIRALATVQGTSSTGVQVPKLTALPTALWVAEAGTKAETTGLTYGLETILAHELYAYFISSQAQLEDAAFDLEAEIRNASIIQFGVAEGSVFLSGNGVGKPKGILSYSGIGTQTCADSSAHTLAGADLMLALQKLKEPYQANASFLIKSQALGRIRTQVITTGGPYVWGPLAEGKPPTILGQPYYLSCDLDDDGTITKIPAIVGDFRIGYRIIDRIAIEVVRDIYTLINKGQVQFVVRKRVGGASVLPEAFVKCVTA